MAGPCASGTKLSSAAWTGQTATEASIVRSWISPPVPRSTTVLDCEHAGVTKMVAALGRMNPDALASASTGKGVDGVVAWRRSWFTFRATMSGAVAPPSWASKAVHGERRWYHHLR
ncbi:hypothetical protein GCM10017788_75440 [Amycolatopsis acidiphila]|nr:hypothetical protein GCM10017788_75440 [Amycolatopsis acidiphila]